MKYRRNYIHDCITMENPYAMKYMREIERGNESDGVVHHIVPVYFFKNVLKVKKLRIKGTDKRNGSIDMCPDNLLVVSEARHVVLHYYLYRASTSMLSDSAMNAFAMMFENGGMETVSNSIEYSHLLDEMKSEYDMLVETGRHTKHIFKVNGSKHEANGILPKISYSIALKNTNRGHAAYYGRIRHNHRETCVKLYEREDLSRIWLNRVSTMYTIAMESISKTGTIDETILSNVLTIDNAHEIYQKFLPVQFSDLRKLPDIYYGIKAPNKGRSKYLLIVIENGKRVCKTLPATTEPDARAIVSRIKRVYDDAKSIDVAGFPVPQHIMNVIVHPETNDISRYFSECMVPFMDTGDVPSAQHGDTVEAALEQWEISMRRRGLKSRSIDVMIKNVEPLLDKKMLVRNIGQDVIASILDSIQKSTTRNPESKYRNITNMRTFIKFVTAEYNMPARLIELCYIKRSALKDAA